MSSSDSSSRDPLIQIFLENSGHPDPALEPLGQDASSRRYFRLGSTSPKLMLMDAPPESENPGAFARVTRYLEQLGARVPGIIAADIDNGLLLIEDLGDQTFTRLLQAGADETTLYRQAIEALADMQLGFADAASSITLPPYDFATLYAEAQLFIDWYLPARLGREVSDDERSRYEAIWRTLFNARSDLSDVLVHRDYHVDNLLIASGQCAMLDYQDALIGSPLYDLVSLLEDARRDVNADLQQQMIALWCERTGISKTSISREYKFWGAQRHCKVAGIFVRLWQRDGKPHYLEHLDRVMGLLASNLADEQFTELREWLRPLLPETRHGPLTTFKK